MVIQSHEWFLAIADWRYPACADVNVRSNAGRKHPYPVFSAASTSMPIEGML